MSVSISASASEESPRDLSRSCLTSFPSTCLTCQTRFSSSEIPRDHSCNSAVSSETKAAPQAKESLSNYSPNSLQCLFCNSASQTLSHNFVHMFQAHGTFIPEQERLINPQGLVIHLSQQVSQFHECISCGSTKTTTSGVQSHMIDRGHCMLSFDLDPLLKSFWDFSIDNSDSEVVDQYPETMREQSNSPEYCGSHLASSCLYSTDLSLYLPSGKTLGHRSLSRYYRQNLHSKPLLISQSHIQAITGRSTFTLEAPQPSHRTRLQPTAVSKGMIGVPEAKRREVRAVAKRAQRSEWRSRCDGLWAVQREGNRQKFFKVSFSRCVAIYHGYLEHVVGKQS